MSTPPAPNTLYYGDNLAVLREYVADESVDLIYLDPPFNSNADYNVLFAERDGTEAAAQIKAFGDTWKWTVEAEQAFRDAVQSGHGRVPEAMRGFRAMIGETDMLAYLAMMAPRLVELHRVLKPTGSLYLHCDPTASHYLKLMLDAIFGPEQYLNEIIWKRTTAHNDKGQGAVHFGRVHDTIFRYAKDKRQVSSSDFSIPHDPAYIASHYRGEDADGRRFRYDNLTGPGGAAKGNPSYEVLGVVRFWRYSKERMAQLVSDGLVEIPPKGKVPALKRYLDEQPGMPLGDAWTDIPPINSQAAERLGYPTQKPEALLQRIVNASSNEGDVVLDPFCGCGTAVAVAQRLNRRWVGIDVTHLAVNLIKHRLKNSFGVGPAKGRKAGAYAVVGEPESASGAEQLAEDDPFQFQAWALGLVQARVTDSDKKGADRGVDGRLFFHDDPNETAAVKQVVLQVKGGTVGVKDVRDLRGVLEREEARGAVMAALITLHPPTRPMVAEAAAAGLYDTPNPSAKKALPRVQLLTVEGLIDGTERLELPPYVDIRTVRKAPKAKRKSDRRQRDLL